VALRRVVSAGGVIVTNLTWRSKRVVRFYNGRGTAGAMDQGGQERREVDEALLPDVQGQPDPFAVVRVGI